MREHGQHLVDCQTDRFPLDSEPALDVGDGLFGGITVEVMEEFGAVLGETEVLDEDGQPDSLAEDLGPVQD